MSPGLGKIKALFTDRRGLVMAEYWDGSSSSPCAGSIGAGAYDGLEHWEAEVGRSWELPG